jgi:hypothetical protein
LLRLICEGKLNFSKKAVKFEHQEDEAGYEKASYQFVVHLYLRHPSGLQQTVSNQPNACRAPKPVTDPNFNPFALARYPYLRLDTFVTDGPVYKFTQ